jgi:hypothetical protein
MILTCQGPKHHAQIGLGHQLHFLPTHQPYLDQPSQPPLGLPHQHLPIDADVVHDVVAGVVHDESPDDHGIDFPQKHPGWLLLHSVHAASLGLEGVVQRPWRVLRVGFAIHWNRVFISKKSVRDVAFKM